MKRLAENKKLWIVAAVILLVAIAIIIGISVKSCLSKPEKKDSGIGTEQERENGTGKDANRDKNGSQDRDTSQDGSNNDRGLTVVEPKDGDAENSIDASGSWDEPSEPTSSGNNDDKTGTGNDKTENSGNSTANNDNNADDNKDDGGGTAGNTPGDEDNILKDDKEWGNIF